MALNIPNVGTNLDALMGGIKTGSGMFANLMHPILEREKQKQAEAHFQEQLKLSKAAAGRAGANTDIQRQILQQQLLGLQHKNDPMYKFNEYKALQDMIMGSGQQQNASVMPTEETGQGMGVFTPEGLQEVQQMPQEPAQNGMNLDALKQNPMLRGFFKSQFGVDPLAAVPQTPEEKQAMALDLFAQKEEMKKQNKGGDVPTNTVLTQNQQALQGINTVIPMLDELISNPKNIYGSTDFSPSKKAAYNAKTSGMIDTLVAAQSLPKVQASIDLVEQQIRRGTNESVDSYIKRLKDLRKDLVNRKGRAKDVLSNRKVNTNDDDDFSQMSDDELRKIAGGQ